MHACEVCMNVFRCTCDMHVICMHVEKHTSICLPTFMWFCVFIFVMSCCLQIDGSAVSFMNQVTDTFRIRRIIHKHKHTEPHTHANAFAPIIHTGKCKLACMPIYAWKTQTRTYLPSRTRVCRCAVYTASCLLSEWPRGCKLLIMTWWSW